MVVVVSGCGTKSGPRVYPVTGTVLYEGKPVLGAVVAFRGEGATRIATGTTDAQGRFKLTTYNSGDGTVAGKHKVTISKEVVEGAMESKDLSMEEAVKYRPPPVKRRRELPAKYADPARPLIEVTVSESSPNDFTWNLEK